MAIECAAEDEYLEIYRCKISGDGNDLIIRYTQDDKNYIEKKLHCPRVAEDLENLDISPYEEDLAIIQITQSLFTSKKCHLSA